MFRKILIPVDLAGEPAQSATTTVIELARGWGASLEFIHVIPGYGSAWVESFFPADLEQDLPLSTEDAPTRPSFGAGGGRGNGGPGGGLVLGQSAFARTRA